MVQSLLALIWFQYLVSSDYSYATDITLVSEFSRHLNGNYTGNTNYVWQHDLQQKKLLVKQWELALPTCTHSAAPQLILRRPIFPKGHLYYAYMVLHVNKPINSVSSDLKYH